MTIFLALSALVNIALGYGLAIFLGHARMKQGNQSEELPHIDSYAEPMQAAIPEPMAPPAPAPDMHAPPTPMPAPAEVAAVAPPVAAAPAEPVAAAAEESAELETDVLAGIEEFRNQLAQMKAQPEGTEAAAAPMPQPATAGV